MTRQEWLASLDVGDRVDRWIGAEGIVRRPMIVSARTPELITVVPQDTPEHRASKAFADQEMGGDFGHLLYWTFHPITGAEIYETLGWDGLTITGSVIKAPQGSDSSPQK